MGDCSLLEQAYKLQRINFRHLRILNSPPCSSRCRVRTASCPIFMAIISEAQLLALFQEALKAGRTFGRATSRQLAIWGLKITYTFEKYSLMILTGMGSKKIAWREILSDTFVIKEVCPVSSGRGEKIHVKTKLHIISHH